MAIVLKTIGSKVPEGSNPSRSSMASQPKWRWDLFRKQARIKPLRVRLSRLPLWKLAVSSPQLLGTHLARGRQTIVVLVHMTLRSSERCLNGWRHYWILRDMKMTIGYLRNLIRETVKWGFRRRRSSETRRVRPTGITRQRQVFQRFRIRNWRNEFQILFQNQNSM